MATTTSDIIIGRKEEIAILEAILKSNKAELVAIYGRRRIGKTFLIRTFFKAHLSIEFSGTFNTPVDDQLYHFAEEVAKISKTKINIPANWQQAFILLIKQLEKTKHNNKKVIFFDELLWLDTFNSGFLTAFTFWWQTWCSKRKDLIVVICGPTKNWEKIKKENNEISLHNSITKEIQLLPFTLAETESFLLSKKVKLNQFEIAQLHMVMGGVPLYLNAVRPSKSVTQNIDALCFSAKGLLRNEFNKLYETQFNNDNTYLSIIKALASNQQGIILSEITKIANLKSGTALTEILIELYESGYISIGTPYNKKIKNKIYRLTDEYSLFYLKFIENNNSHTAETWNDIYNTQSYKVWSNYAFVNLCLKHILNIKQALGIGGVYTEQKVWRYKTEKEQIDLIIKRADKCSNICIIKFATKPLLLTKPMAKRIVNKSRAFQRVNNISFGIITTLITLNGIKRNYNYINNIDNAVGLEAFFKGV